MLSDISRYVILPEGDAMPKENTAPMTEAMFYVMLALLEPLHGYGIMEKIADITHGRIKMGPGTLYGILTRMENEKLIVLEEDDGRRKTYRLTANGVDALHHEYERLFTMVQDGNKQLKESYRME